MTYLKILSYARRGIRAEIEQNREMQGNAFDGEPCDPVDGDFIFIPRRDTW